MGWDGDSTNCFVVCQQVSFGQAPGKYLFYLFYYLLLNLLQCLLYLQLVVVIIVQIFFFVNVWSFSVGPPFNKYEAGFAFY